MNSIAVRVQGLSPQDRVIVIARIVEGRSADRSFSPADITDALNRAAIPAPAKVSNALSALAGKGYTLQSDKKGRWKLTPVGRARSMSLIPDMDLTAFAVEVAGVEGAMLGNTVQTVIPPLLAPPLIMPALRPFLERYPFETNVFGMTRFPDASETDESLDPVGDAVEIARRVCGLHGLDFHLASDRMLADDLWTNIGAHIWASKYGIAFFEDRVGRGMNYNLNIEVGAMLVTGRRCALLKDSSIPRMPTDLVGKIYKEVDLDDLDSISTAIHTWLREDLGFGPCVECSPKSVTKPSGA